MLKVKLYSKHIGKSPEQIEADMKRPKYFSPTEAVEYGIIDKVVYNERGSQDRGVVSDLKKAQLIWMSELSSEIPWLTGKS